MNLIDKKREAAGDLVLEIAETHKWHFVQKIAALAHVEPFTFVEPYLKDILPMFLRQYMDGLDIIEAFGEQKSMAVEEKLQALDDDLERRMNAKLDEFRQQAVGVEKYRWRTQNDEKVRASHAHNAGRLFSWNEPPVTGHPGEDFGCRCYAEPVVEEGFQIAESGEIVSDGVVNIPTHIKLPKSGDKILVADPVTGKVPDKVNIFIGGAADEYINGNVLNSYALHRDIAGENYYFTHNSALEINNLVVGLSQDQKANLIGHSLGGATAAQVALANPGKINVLVTVDPVGPINVGRDPVTNVHILEFPDYERVSESVDTWININAGETPESTFFDDFINGNNVAEVGGKWGGDPEGDADIYLNPELDHGDFDGMLRYVDQNTGKSAEEILNE